MKSNRTVLQGPYGVVLVLDPTHPHGCAVVHARAQGHAFAEGYDNALRSGEVGGVNLKVGALAWLEQQSDAVDAVYSLARMDAAPENFAAAPTITTLELDGWARAYTPES